MLRVDDLDAADHVALALGDGLFDGLPVDGGDVVPVPLRGRDLELAGGALGVVAGPEHPAVGDLLARIAEVPVEGRGHDLPAELHLAGLRVDLDADEDALVVRRVLLDGRVGALGDRDREAGSHHRVLGVRRDERRAVNARDVRDGPEDLLRLEVAQVDPRHAAVHVVDEEPAAVVVAVGFREGRVVHVAPGQVAEHRLRLVVIAVARGRVGRVHRDRRKVAHRGDAVDVDLARVASRGEQVELVEVARRDVGLLGGDGDVRRAGGPALLRPGLGRARARTGRPARGGWRIPPPRSIRSRTSFANS